MEHVENEDRTRIGIKDAIPCSVGAVGGFAAYYVITFGQINELSRQETVKPDANLDDSPDGLIASQQQFLNAFNLDTVGAGASANSETHAIAELRSEQPHGIDSPEVFGIGGSMLGLALTVAAIVGTKRRKASE